MGEDREKHKSKDKHRDRDRGVEKARRDDKTLRDDKDRSRRDRDKDAGGKDRERAASERREREERERTKAERVRSERDAGTSNDRHREKERPRRDYADDEYDGRRDVKDRREKRHRDDDDRGERDHRADRDRDREKDRDRDGHRDKKRRSEIPESRDAADERRKAKQEEEQAALDDEAERRRKRVQAWQEQKAKQMAEEEEAAKAAAEEAVKWTFSDDESDEEDTAAGGVGANGEAKPMEEDEDEVDPLDAFMSQNDAHATQLIKQAEEKAKEEEEEIDPLDAFMAAEVLPAVTQNGLSKPSQAKSSAARAQSSGMLEVEGAGESEAAPPSSAAPRKRPGAGAARRRPKYYSSDSDSDEGDEDWEEEDDADWAKNTLAGKLSKSDKLGVVDHSTINYPPFRRSFYTETGALAKMTDEEVAAYRKELDDIKVRGKNIPKPVQNWFQCGLSSRVLELLQKSGFAKPMPIQAQALPAIMSGRDCIGIAKTGSGKTLAFVLPMLRHIKDQPPLAQGDGPVALIMAPTRELVVQIGKDIRRFSKALSLSIVCAYGGSAVAGQISDLKRGAEVVVCTPGRMIDLLATSGGKITNLRRVTYLVMDEADRMFDMGFEPQIMRIVSNIRPDRQTVMFSATFPRAVEVLAKQVLQSPIEIQVGGRSVVNSDISQFVEIRPEEDRFLRLLEILGEWYEKGKILIFVSSQDQCDNLFRDLIKVGYPCLSLHGGKDQSDRESTINDFKSDVCNLLVATGVAARGLDVKELVLVVNYDTPNHHEEYVHRVGRTGRAGNKGTAITFIAPDDDKYAPDLVKALRESGAAVPKDLQVLADSFAAKRKAGTVQAHGSGYGGTGFKFDNQEDEERKALRKQTAKEVAKEAGMSSDEEEEDESDVRKVMPGEANAALLAAQNAAANALQAADLPASAQAQVRQAQELAARLMAQAAAQPQQMPQPAAPPPVEVNPMLEAAQRIARQLAEKAGMPVTSVTPMPAYNPNVPSMWAQPGSQLPAGPHFEAELEINDFPQHARWKVTHRDTIAQLNELTGAAVTTKGVYVPPRTEVPEGERKLFLLIEGPTEAKVREAKAEIKRILEEYTEKAMKRDAAPQTGKYTIMRPGPGTCLPAPAGDIDFVPWASAHPPLACWMWVPQSGYALHVMDPATCSLCALWNNSLEADSAVAPLMLHCCRASLRPPVPKKETAAPTHAGSPTRMSGGLLIGPPKVFQLQ
ncbi:DEAD-box ATP-dependent RNA helicase 42 [Coccomyxa sp. Obi]|nr:DEAD-box ATP-dependent RNA helicase 42 [Coccomyxa sp. Obi]